MRLFVAVDLDDTVRDAAAGFAGRLAEGLAGGPAARQIAWVQPANLHMTMRFIGATDDDLAERLREALTPGFSTRAFDAELSGAGMFPGSMFARVVWLGVDRGAPMLTALADEIETRVRAAGVEPETRPFSAHVTIARIRRPDRRVGLALQRALDATSFPAASWRVGHLTLYESRLSPQGSTYLPVMQAVLGTDEGHMIGFLLLGYLIGSIPFAFLLARHWGRVDVRLAGSGNVGAANVMRTTRKTVGVAVALLDLAKGSAVVIVADRLGAGESMRAATGVAAVIGHVYPVWLRFRGGKGVATSCGVFAMLAPVATALAAICFLVTVIWTRYISLASIVATLLLGPLAYATHGSEPVLTGIALTATMVLYRHRTNLIRLRDGTERRIDRRDVMAHHD